MLNNQVTELLKPNSFLQSVVVTADCKKRRYYVTTWDPERQEYTPQSGVRTGPYSLFGLRKALRKLRAWGYGCERDDFFVYVEATA